VGDRHSCLLINLMAHLLQIMLPRVQYLQMNFSEMGNDLSSKFPFPCPNVWIAAGQIKVTDDTYHCYRVSKLEDVAGHHFEVFSVHRDNCG
jgi:hypothetical protein